ncbi:MAG: hypothetical protein AB7V16_01455 [Vulcanibacillus sp.]
MGDLLDYKKPAFWVTFIAVVVIILVLVLLANPRDTGSNLLNEDPMKGLELYVWKNKDLTGNNDTYFTLLMGTNRNKDKNEIYDLGVAVNSIEELNQLLASYSTETELFIYQMNTVDFTKDEMSIIADKINFPVGNGVKTIGLWHSNIVELNLEIIMSSPLYSSNPQDYINAHQNEYGNIIKQGDEALNYLLSQFAIGDNNDLRGHIMMLLCKEILGDRNNVQDESLLPQEWYNELSIQKGSKA